MSYIPQRYLITPFQEQVSTLRNSSMSYKPTWGAITTLYDITSGSNGYVTGSNGEIKLHVQGSGSYAAFQTKQRGQYKAGYECEFGAGVRIPTYPAQQQVIKAGYFDTEDGFGFGKDATDLFVFLRKGGVDTVIYQTDWNGYTGSLDDENGLIFQGNFIWYGYGDIIWYAVTDNGAKLDLTELHRLNPSDLTINNPNLPLRFELWNQASTGSLDYYVGGHQFSVLSGDIQNPRRQTAVPIFDFDLQTNTNWQPIMAIRKKERFNGFLNSVNVRLESFNVVIDEIVQIRLTYDGNVANGNWNSPIGWNTNETAIEAMTGSSAVALSSTNEGKPIAYDFIGSAKKDSYGVISNNVDLLLGNNTEVILWVRNPSGTASTVIGASVTVTEEF